MAQILTDAITYKKHPNGVRKASNANKCFRLTLWWMMLYEYTIARGDREYIITADDLSQWETKITKSSAVWFPCKISSKLSFFLFFIEIFVKTVYNLMVHYSLPPLMRLCFSLRLFVRLSVCLLVISRKNYRFDLHENFTRDVSMNEEELIKFWT